MKRAPGGCPDLESIAAFLDNRLSKRERARVADHLAACDACYVLFSEAAAIGPRVTAKPGWLRGGRAWLARPKVVWPAGVAAAAVAAVWLLVATGGLERRRSGELPELAELVAAVGSERTIEGRLTGGFGFGPVRGPVRAGTVPAETVSPDIRIAAARIEKKALERRTPDALHALGVADLVTGDVNRAVPVLEEAARQRAASAGLLSDLAAAYLARAAAHGDQPEDVAKALAAADRAVKIDAKLAEASFNRALALERLSRRDEARQAWQDYLKIDDKSEWATEARLRMSIVFR